MNGLAKTKFLVGAALGLLGSFTTLLADAPLPVADLQIRLDQVRCRMSPILHGMMTEEVNHTFDGGLYAELIQNRIFQDDAKNPVHWSIVGADSTAMTLDRDHPVNEAMPVSLHLDASHASATHRVGVANDGFWGVSIQPFTTYRASFYARAGPGFAGPLHLTLETADGTRTLAEAQVSGVTGAWHRYQATLTTQDIPPMTGRFLLLTETPGQLWFDLVSLFPPTFNLRPNGTRPDLMRLLAGMKPKILRLPGGNYLEGDTLRQRFPWENAIGPLDQRPGHQGPWGYRSSDGFGLLEMLDWCEDLRIKPVLAVFAGYSLRGQQVEPGPLLAPYVKEALDEVDYATGDASTSHWAAMRARDGHPAPFAIDYVEIGNEDWFDKSRSYEGRFAQFHDAFKARYPRIKLIATEPVKSRRPDMIDEHYYLEPEQFEAMASHYDSYDRTGPKIFVGEWATRSKTVTPNFRATLSDAAWYTGLERNSDVVIMESYAPLFVHLGQGARQWQPNLIGFDSLSSFGSPTYWMLKMFADSSGDTVPVSTLTGGGTHFFYSVVQDNPQGILYLKVVNTDANAKVLHLQLEGARDLGNQGEATILACDDLTACNTLAEPHRIEPRTEPFSVSGAEFTYTFQPHSITVIKIPAAH